MSEMSTCKYLILSSTNVSIEDNSCILQYDRNQPDKLVADLRFILNTGSIQRVELAQSLPEDCSAVIYHLFLEFGIQQLVLGPDAINDTSLSLELIRSLNYFKVVALNDCLSNIYPLLLNNKSWYCYHDRMAKGLDEDDREDFLTSIDTMHLILEDVQINDLDALLSKFSQQSPNNVSTITIKVKDFDFSFDQDFEIYLRQMLAKNPHFYLLQFLDHHGNLFIDHYSQKRQAQISNYYQYLTDLTGTLMDITQIPKNRQSIVAYALAISNFYDTQKTFNYINAQIDLVDHILNEGTESILFESMAIDLSQLIGASIAVECEIFSLLETISENMCNIPKRVTIVCNSKEKVLVYLFLRTLKGSKLEKLTKCLKLIQQETLFSQKLQSWILRLNSNQLLTLLIH